MIKNILISFFYLITFFIISAKALENCEWNNQKDLPCITIGKTPNSSIFSQEGINKTVISKKDILNSGALDAKDVLKLVPGIDVFQSGQFGQQTSIFTRGSESNHTLVL